MNPAQDPDPVSSLTSVGDTGPAASGGADRETLSQIKRRSSPLGKLVAAALVLLVGSVSVFMFISYRQGQAEEQLINEAGKFPEGSPEMLAALRAAWPELTSRKQQLRVVQNLFYFQDPEAGPLYLEALEAGGGIGRFAALGLAAMGPPGPEGVVQRLEQALQDSEPLVDRTAITWALAVFQGDAPDAILEDFAAGRYQEDEDIKAQFDPAIIAKALGPERLRDPALVTHEEPAVRLLTAQALGEIGGEESVEPLNALLQNELSLPRDEQSRELIEAAAAGLGRTGDPSAVDILAAVTAQHPALRSSIHNLLRRSASAPKLALLLGGAAQGQDRRALLDLLAQTHDPQVADTFASLLSDPDDEIRFAAAMALSEFGDARAAETLIEMVGGDDLDQIDEALEGLVRIASPDASSKLLALFPDSCPAELGPDSPKLCLRRAQVIRALGAAGGQAAARRIEKALGTSDSLVAAVTLADLNHSPVLSKLISQAERPAGENMGALTQADRRLEQEELLLRRKAAIVALGHFARPDAEQVLTAIVEAEGTDDYELRGLAARSLGMIESEEVMRRALEKVLDPNLPDDTRAYYGGALWLSPNPSLKAEYLNVIKSRAPAGSKRGAAMAYGRVVGPEDEEVLLSLLDDEATRTGGAIAILLGGTPAAARKLLDWFGQDRNMTEDVERLLQADAESAFNRLTTESFETGHVWSQLEVASILNAGNDSGRFPTAWTSIIRVLKTGSEETNGVRAHEARMRFFDALTGDDDRRRQLAAQALRAADEFGLLLRARDAGGPGASEARAQLLGR